mmetsp:Transcript_51931/g.166251  ORF Transcript_51931/g.166251 Transcript_51931/m.166251 type:complete len:450 (-) Transcript_51931:212-1561(-)
MHCRHLRLPPLLHPLLAHVQEGGRQQVQLLLAALRCHVTLQRLCLAVRRHRGRLLGAAAATVVQPCVQSLDEALVLALQRPAEVPWHCGRQVAKGLHEGLGARGGHGCPAALRHGQGRGAQKQGQQAVLQHLLVGGSCGRPALGRRRLCGQQPRVVRGRAEEVRRRPGGGLRVQPQVPVDGLLQRDHERRRRWGDPPGLHREPQAGAVGADGGVWHGLQQQGCPLARLARGLALVRGDPHRPDLEARRACEEDLVHGFQRAASQVQPGLAIEPLRVQVRGPDVLQAEPASDHCRRRSELRRPAGDERPHHDGLRETQVADAAGELGHHRAAARELRTGARSAAAATACSTEHAGGRAQHRRGGVRRHRGHGQRKPPSCGLPGCSVGVLPATLAALDDPPAIPGGDDVAGEPPREAERHPAIRHELGEVQRAVLRPVALAAHEGRAVGPC